MKRMLSLLLACMLCATLASCGSKPYQEDPSPDQDIASSQNRIEETSSVESTSPLKKLDEDLKRANPFSEGLAYVVTTSGNGYFVNEEKEVVIDLSDIPHLSVPETCIFINGLATIDTYNGSLINKEGKITRPEDVGVTRFFNSALEGGYLLAEVVEANYASTVKKLGVMDTNFKWVFQPTQENYNLLCGYRSYLPSLNHDAGENNLNIPTSARNYFYKDYLFISDLEQFLSFKDFTLHSEWEYDHVPETWSNDFPKKYRAINNDTYNAPVFLDLSNLPNVDDHSKFSNGHAIVTFKNGEYCYFTLIDSEGNFCFDPIYAGDGINSVTAVAGFDGAQFMVRCGGNNYKIYDKNGNLLKEKILSQDFISINYFGEGIIKYGNSFYSLDLTPLF